MVPGLLFTLLLTPASDAMPVVHPRRMSVTAPSRTIPGFAEMLLDGPAFKVPPGARMAGRIQGEALDPATDPGRSLIRIAIETPLYDRDHRTLLLPAGTQFLGPVHLLRGERRFMGFQTVVLPDGRTLAAPEDAFLLGPGPSLVFESGEPATITVARPLKIGAFGR